MRALLAAVCLVASPALAQDTLRETPDYFAAAVFDVSTAQALARSCATISVDPVATVQRSEALLTQLVEDGFSTEAPHLEMDNPDAAIRELQAAFVERYGLVEPSEERVCEVARLEITEGSGIGTILLDLNE